VAGTLATAGMLAALIAAPSEATRARPAQAACTPAANIEVIIDDSGSMAVSDSNRLRVQGLNLLINTLDPGTTLGAVEFGSTAETDFPPASVGANAAAMKSALAAKVQADDGGTDYNPAFSRADADNPGAQARIFLTDGENGSVFANGHLAHRVPTYVIGFDDASLDPAATALLQKIATDTGGKYFRQTDSSSLQSVMNEIGAALTCSQAPTLFTDTISQGQVATHAVRITRGPGTLVIALTWSSPLDRFTLSRLRLVRNGNVIAVAAAKQHKPRRLPVRRTTSSTFSVVRVSRLAAGRLSFRVKATRIGSGAPKVSLTTQVTRRRAAPPPANVFRTPTHNIVCEHSPAGRSPGSIECGIHSGLKPAPARVNCNGHGDFVKNRLALQATGPVQAVTCAGDPGPFALETGAPVLRYGHRYSGGGITCTSRFKGLTCTNRDGHGFFLSRQRWRAL
jgi:uncharacterized protein DUF6636/VWA domain-containing protein